MTDTQLDTSNVLDPVTSHSITVKGEFNDSISTGPTFNDHPQTGADAIYRAELVLEPDITVQSCEWLPVDYDLAEGQIPANITQVSPTEIVCEGRRPPRPRLASRPDDVQYGQRKVQLRLSYSVSGVPAPSLHSIEHDFELFFGKWEKDASAGRQVPNWFVWWGMDGAIEELRDQYTIDLGSLEYESDAGRIIRFKDRRQGMAGQYQGPEDPGKSPIEIYPAAALNIGVPPFPGCNYQQPDHRGITQLAETVRHEGFHRGVDYRFYLGDWQDPAAHSDSDRLIDAYEQSLAGRHLEPGYDTAFTRFTLTSPSDPDSCDVESAFPGDWYRDIGDQEVDARVLGTAWAAQSTNSMNDWANPGARSGWSSGPDDDYGLRWK